MPEAEVTEPAEGEDDSTIDDDAELAAEPEPEAPAEPEHVEPVMWTEDRGPLSSAGPAVDVEIAEPVVPAAESVTFRCDQWAGVALHGHDVKFENHYFTTSDEAKIAVVEAWGHAMRVVDA